MIESFTKRKKLVHFIFVNDILVYEKIKLKMHGVPKNEMPTILDFFFLPNDEKNNCWVRCPLITLMFLKQVF